DDENASQPYWFGGVLTNDRRCPALHPHQGAARTSAGL
ncbi:MAG: hypothetical protein AVDCRST_MAG42-534, partial [uncultured Chthoniobacterales bacterium]